MRYLFDANLSPRMAQILHLLGADVGHLYDRFPRNISDIDLLAALTGEVITLVTADNRIAVREPEARALRQCGVSAIFLGSWWGKQDLWAQCTCMLKHWKAIDAHVARLDPPVYFAVASNGKLTRQNV